MFNYSKASFKFGEFSSMYKFDRDSWEGYLKDNKLCYMDSQRSVDNNHVDNIIEYLNNRQSSKADTCFLTPIVIGLLNNKYYIIDGQHRICALCKFEGRYDLLVNLINIKDIEDLEYHLCIVNTNKPYIQVGNKEVKKIEEYISSNYKGYIKPSDNPRAPHINMNNVVKCLNSHTNLTFRLFFEKFNELELFIQENYKELGISNTVFLKSQKDNIIPFYSGCMKNNNWIKAIIMSIESNKKISDLDYTKFPFTVKRHKITSSDRDKLWKTQSDTLCSNCYVCKDDITYRSFQCGHVVPVFSGGDNSISNMKCICPSCNTNMGVMNLEEYKLLVKN
jgi:5-methylcytosine-specific restriction endonuclease McrA